MKKKFLAVLAAAFLLLVLFAFPGAPPAYAAERSYTAEQIDGVDGIKDTTQIRVTFSDAVTALPPEAVTVTGATFDWITASFADTTWKTWIVDIKDITVANGESVTISFDNTPYYTFVTPPLQVTLYKDTRTHISFAVSQVGGVEYEATTTGILIAFDKPVPDLTADKISASLPRGEALPINGLTKIDDSTYLIDVTFATSYITATCRVDINDWPGWTFNPGFALTKVYKDKYTHVTFQVEQLEGVDGIADTKALAIKQVHTDDGSDLPSQQRTVNITVKGAVVTEITYRQSSGRYLLYLDPNSFKNGDEITVSAPDWRSINFYTVDNSPAVKIYRDEREAISYTAEAIARYDEHGIVSGTAGVLFTFDKPVPARVPGYFHFYNGVIRGEAEDYGDNDDRTWFIPLTNIRQSNGQFDLSLPANDPEYRLVSPNPGYYPQCSIPFLEDTRTRLYVKYSCNGMVSGDAPWENGTTTTYVSLEVVSTSAIAGQPHNVFKRDDLPWVKIGSKVYHPDWQVGSVNHTFSLGQNNITLFENGDKLTFIYPDLDRARFHDPVTEGDDFVILKRKPLPPDGRGLDSVNLSPSFLSRVDKLTLTGKFRYTAVSVDYNIAGIRLRDNNEDRLTYGDTEDLTTDQRAKTTTKTTLYIDVKGAQMLKQPGVYEAAFFAEAEGGEVFLSEYHTFEVRDNPDYGDFGYAILAITQQSDKSLRLGAFMNESELEAAGGEALIVFRGLTRDINGDGSVFEVYEGTDINNTLVYLGALGDKFKVEKHTNGKVSIEANHGYLKWESVPLTPFGFNIELDPSKKYRTYRKVGDENDGYDANVEITSILAGKTINLFFFAADMQKIKLYKNAASVGGYIKLGATMEALGDAAQAALNLNELILDNDPDTIIPLMHVEAKLELSPGKILGIKDVLKAGGKLNFELNTLPETIPNYIGFSGELDISELLFIEGEFILAWGELGGFPVFVPDTVKFFARSGKGGIPLVPPVVVAFFTGLGGGFEGLGSTILGVYPQVPPIKVMLSAAMQDVTTSIIELEKGTITAGPSELSLYANSMKLVKVLTITDLGMGIGFADPTVAPNTKIWCPEVYYKYGGGISLLGLAKAESKGRIQISPASIGESLMKIFEDISKNGPSGIKPADIVKLLDAIDIQTNVSGQLGVDTPFGFFGGKASFAMNKKAMTLTGKVTGSIGPFSKSVKVTFNMLKLKFDVDWMAASGLTSGDSKEPNKARMELTNLHTLGRYKAGASKSMSAFSSNAHVSTVDAITIPDMTAGDVATLYSTEKPAFIRVFNNGVEQEPFAAQWLDGVAGVEGYEDGEVFAASYVVSANGDWIFEANGILDGAHIRIDDVPSFEFVTAQVVGKNVEVLWELDDVAAEADYDMWVNLQIMDNNGDIVNNMIVLEAAENDDDEPKYNYPEAGKGEYTAPIPASLPSGSYYVSARLLRLATRTDKDPETGEEIVETYEETIGEFNSDKFDYANPITPGTPANVRAEYVGNGAIDVKWDAVSSADGYVVRLTNEYGVQVSGFGHMQTSSVDTEATIHYGVATYDTNPDKPTGSTSVLEHGKAYQFSVQAFKTHKMEVSGDTEEENVTYELPVYGQAGSVSYIIPKPEIPVLKITTTGTRRLGKRNRSEKIRADAISVNSMKPDFIITSDIDADIDVYHDVYMDGLDGDMSSVLVKSGRGGPDNPLSFSLEFEQEGMYTLRAEAMNGKDTGGASVNIIVDTTPPFLDVDESSFTIANGKVRVTGYVEKGAIVSANGARVIPKEGERMGGVFEFEAPAEGYDTTIYITARDIAGNTARRVLTITSAITMTASELDSFGSFDIPYAQPAPQTVTITNTGTEPITLEEPSTTNPNSNYIIGALSTRTLAAEGTATFTVRPKANLPAGDYQETIRILGSGTALATTTARFVVNKPIDPNNSATIKGKTIDLEFSAAEEGWIWNAAKKTLELTGGDVSEISITTDDDIIITITGDASATGIINNGAGGLTIQSDTGKTLTLNSTTGPAISAAGDIVFESGTVYAMTAYTDASAIESTAGSVSIRGTAAVTGETLVGEGGAISAASSINISTGENVKAAADTGYSLEAAVITISGGVTELFFGKVNGGDAFNVEPAVSGENTIVKTNGDLYYPIYVTSITVTGAGGATIITTAGGSLQMSAVAAPVDATNKSVTWSVTNGTGSADISASGLLTAISDGTVTVKAIANDGSGVEGTLGITISGQIIKVTGITVTGAGNATTITTAGGALQMSSAVEPANAADKSVAWSVTNGTGRAMISAGGLLTAISNGTVTVRATANDGSGVEGTLGITISGQFVPVSGITVTGAGNATTITTPGGELQMYANVTPSDANDASVTWSVTNGTGRATISSGGLLEAFGNGTVTVRATANDGSGVSGTLVIIISGQFVPVTSITVSGAGGATVITTDGGSLQMSAAVLPADATNKAVSWGVINVTGSAMINESGLLIALGNGTVTVKASASDGSGVEGTLEITISGQDEDEPVTRITVTGAGNATTITTDRGTLQMSAAVEPDDATDKSVTWSVTNGTGSATVSSSGLLTATDNGTVTVRATANDGSNVFGILVITISGQTPPEPPTITTVSLPNGAVGTAYSQILAATGDAAIIWSIQSGALPGGLNLSGVGVISGMPAAIGAFSFMVKAENNVGSDTKAFSIIIDVIIPPGGKYTLPGGVEVVFRDGAIISPDGTVTFSGGGLGVVILPGGMSVSLPSGAIINWNDGTITLTGGATFTVETTDGNVKAEVLGSIRFEADGTISLLPSATITTGDGTKITLLGGGEVKEGKEAEKLYLFVIADQKGAEVTFPDNSVKTVPEGTALKINPDGSVINETNISQGGGGCSMFGLEMLALAAIFFLYSRRQ